MNRLTISLVLVGAVLATACGGSGPRSGGSLTLPPETSSTSQPSSAPSTDTSSQTVDTATTATPPATTTAAAHYDIVVYFLDSEGRARPTTRTVTTAGVARAAVETLIGGPNRSEADAGLVTSFPSNSLLLGIHIEDGTATVDMSREFEAGGGSLAIVSRLAQLVYTLTQFDTVDRVQLLLDGERTEYFSGEGVLIGDPLTPEDFQSAVPIGDPPKVASVPTWGPDDIAVSDDPDSSTMRVVLVAGDDTLNVRSTPGIDGRVIGRLEPTVTVRVTGETEIVGGSTWRVIETPSGPGWVNGFYLAPTAVVDPGSLELILTELAERFESGADIADLISERGLWVAHHATPVRFTTEELPGILDSDVTYRWGSNALEPDSPEIPRRTFRQAIADKFSSAALDEDTEILVGELIEGPNGRVVEHAVPVELKGFPFVTVFDPGDDPQYGGLDWLGWVVSFSLEEDAYRVVGLTIDEWAP